MRRYDLDHLRTLVILCLFPIHTFMVWNDFGTRFYVWGGNSRCFSTMIVGLNPWMMSLLFVIAGMCANYSLAKRSKQAFLKERVHKLFVPLVSGMLLLVPLQTWYARRFFYACTDDLFTHMRYFFTHITDLSGYDGCFTPAHLWFLLFLFLFSLLTPSIARFFPKRRIHAWCMRMNLPVLLLGFLAVWGCYYIGNFGGFSLGKYFILYLLGYYVFSEQKVYEIMLHHIKMIVSLFLLCQLILCVAYANYGFYGDGFVNLCGWLGVLSLLALGKRYGDHKINCLAYFKRASFGIYLFHQSWLVMIAYALLRRVNGIYWQALFIMGLSLLFTLFSYEIIRRIPYVRDLFALTHDAS